MKMIRKWVILQRGRNILPCDLCAPIICWRCPVDQNIVMEHLCHLACEGRGGLVWIMGISIYSGHHDHLPMMLTLISLSSWPCAFRKMTLYVPDFSRRGLITERSTESPLKRTVQNRVFQIHVKICAIKCFESARLDLYSMCVKSQVLNGFKLVKICIFQSVWIRVIRVLVSPILHLLGRQRSRVLTEISPGQTGQTRIKQWDIRGQGYHG